MIKEAKPPYTTEIVKNRSAKERLAEGEPIVAILEGAKAERFHARTMLIPSPRQVRDAIAGIPFGKTLSTLELREQLAADSGADVTCPRATTICWQIVAEAAEEDRASGSDVITPWWRVTKDKKPYDKLPGGAATHLHYLKAEGASL